MALTAFFLKDTNLRSFHLLLSILAKKGHRADRMTLCAPIDSFPTLNKMSAKGQLSTHLK